MKHRGQPFHPIRAGGHAERDAAVLDGLLGPADAPGHGRLGHQERSRDLGRAEAADRPQGERNLRRRRERWVAAHEQQDERVIRVGGRGIRGGRQQLPGSVRWTTTLSRRWRACSLRSGSVSRREATVISQARGLAGMPSLGHWVAAASSASCVASSAVSKCP
jgi:hypothetical protein